MLKDKNVLVTGASRGIGREIALICAKNGANVIVNYNDSSEEATLVADEIKSNGVDAILIKADVSKHDEVKAMFKQIKTEVGSLDVCINNAGVLRDNLLLLTRESDYDFITNVNMKGCFNCMQFASKMMMKKKSGKIINISSIIGRYGNSGQIVYAGSKAGVLGMTYAAAKELGQFGITVNAVAPGLIETDMIKNLKQEDIEKMISNISVGRIGKPEDVAKVVLFLASGLSDYVSGQVIGVDGGQII
jgi:3-oxoacyl-[acyl-carrier protein] reductase